MLKINHKLSKRIKKSEIFLIGCSAGGFSVIFDLLTGLGSDFPIPIVVIIHRSSKYKSEIETLLNKKVSLNVKLAEDQEVIKPGTVYFASADYHLLIEPEHKFTLDDSEPVHYCRPAIDVTFQSAADVYKDRVMAILLSGANNDGALGMKYIADMGGVTIVQDPECAEVDTMPQSAIKEAKIDLILSNEDIFRLINNFYR